MGFVAKHFNQCLKINLGATIAIYPVPLFLITFNAPSRFKKNSLCGNLMLTRRLQKMTKNMMLVGGFFEGRINSWRSLLWPIWRKIISFNTKPTLGGGPQPVVTVNENSIVFYVPSLNLCMTAPQFFVELVISMQIWVHFYAILNKITILAIRKYWIACIRNYAGILCPKGIIFWTEKSHMLEL